jgi:hypothetical protein
MSQAHRIGRGNTPIDLRAVRRIDARETTGTSASTPQEVFLDPTKHSARRGQRGVLRACCALAPSRQGWSDTSQAAEPGFPLRWPTRLGRLDRPSRHAVFQVEEHVPGACRRRPPTHPRAAGSAERGPATGDVHHLGRATSTADRAVTFRWLSARSAGTGIATRVTPGASPTRLRESTCIGGGRLRCRRRRWLAGRCSGGESSRRRPRWAVATARQRRRGCWVGWARASPRSRR